jgi:alpha-galactosidase
VNKLRRCTSWARTGRKSQPRPIYFLLWVTILLLSFVSIPHVTAQKNPEARREALRDEVVATYVDGVSLDAAHPAKVWRSAAPIVFSSDWKGQNADPARETSVRVLWSRTYLYLRFECHYRELFTFEDSDPNGRRDHLWDRDVAEAFLQPDPSRARFYREFEIGPNGMWIDLDIFPGGLADLKSGLRRSVAVNEKSHSWTAELAIPMKSLTANFDPSTIWRVNFYRVEGKTEPRAYLAWQPTKTQQPNFHVPSAFGSLRFGGAK